jgi:hypothetical protein
VLLKYIKGELSGYMKNMVERHVASCEMCSDELEGLSLMEKPERIDEITLDLRRKVDETIKLPYKEIPYLSFSVQVAATILVLVGVSAFYFFVIYKQPKLDYVTVARMELDEIATLGKGGNDTLLLGNCDVVKHDKGLLKVETVDEVASLEYMPPVIIDSIPAEKEVVEEIKEEKLVTAEKSDVDERLALSESAVQNVPVSSSKKSAAGSIAFNAKTIFESKDEGVNKLSYAAKKQVAMRLYNKKKYELALNAFESITSELASNDSILLYKSICYYHLTRFDDAILNLSELAKNPRKNQFAEARWYYALSLIGAQRRDEAIVILEQIIKDDSDYKREAKKELNKLKGNE